MKKPRTPTRRIDTPVTRPTRAYTLVWGPGHGKRVRAYWLDDTTGRPRAGHDIRYRPDD